MKIISEIDDDNGAKIKLSNGYQVSVIWGKGAMADNGRVETAIIDNTGNFVEYKGDDVQAYQSILDVLTTIADAEKMPVQDYWASRA